MITSTTNPRVRLLRSLDDQRARRESGLFLVEGQRLAEEALDAGVRPAVALYDEAIRARERGLALLDDLAAAGAALEPASPRVIASVSAVQHPQGIVLAVPIERSPPPFPRRPGQLHDVLLVLDGVADPGNAGTILRAARSAGVRRVAVSAGSVDVYSPKVVRAAAGAHFWLHLDAGFQWSAAGALFAGQGPAILAEAHAGVPYWRVDWCRPVALIVGGEAHGPRVSAKQAVAEHVQIPMPGGGDSLNVALATGILLFEAVRQRSHGTGPA